MPAPYQPGDRVVTPAGVGRVTSITGALGSEVVTVRLHGPNIPSALREYPVAALRPEDLESLDAIEQFLSPTVTLEDVEAFLESHEFAAVDQPDRLGRAVGAKVTLCDCSCGSGGGCQRLSTSSLHFENSGACRCEGRCPCAS